MPAIEELAARQLEAYNASNLEAFVACYHPQVRVFEGDTLLCEGREAFRERYRGLFSNVEFGGEVPKRLAVGGHCVDFERYWRIDPQSGERSEGVVLVHYTECDGLIASVRFLR
jgi:hypothetical protein